MSTIISIVSYPFLPAKTGGQKGIALFYKFFSKYCRLICFTTKNNNPASALYAVNNTISNSPLRYINIFLLFPIYRQIKKQNATHLLLEHPYYGWLGVLLKTVSGVKLVLHSHNIEFLRWKGLNKWWWKILAAYEKGTHRKADYNFFKTDEDRAYAIATFGLLPEKCSTITYGIEWESLPAANERKQCRAQLQQLYAIPDGTTIFLFNGSLDYAPNLQAVKTILEKINPLLLSSGTAYKLLICGRGLPPAMDELRAYAGKNIIYTGFVDDISVYFKGADTFINPVTEGGGIQTKLVEALGYNCTVISTRQGAIGIPPATTGNKMKVVDNGDWEGFAQAMQASANNSDTPTAFFDHFYWQHIAEKAAHFIQ
jgi:glycosyltransferase involved in cell wall biosynthesis